MLPGRVVRGRQNPLHWKQPARLRKARKASKLSASALALAAGVNNSSVAHLEAGVGVPRLSTVERIANALKLSPAYLAFGTEGPWEPMEGVALRCNGLAARAREARTARGLSLREADRRAGRADGTLREFEAGTMPGLDTLEAVAKALSVTPAWLAFGIGPMEAPARRSRLAAAPTRSNLPGVP